MAIKNAREMALLPYENRVTTQRGGRGGDRRQRDDDRRPREPREADAPKQTTTPSPQTEEVSQENTTEESAE